MEVRMKIKMLGALFAVLGSAILVASAEGQNAYLYLAHAAPGRNISSTTNPVYPVDFSVDGLCLAKGVAFGEIAGPLTGAAGTYTLTITAANSAFPCIGAPLFTASVPLAAGTTYIGVLTLDASNKPVGQLYTANLTPIASGLGRLEVINATVDALGATLSGAGPFSVSPGTLRDFTPGAGLYTSTILDVGNNVLVGPVNVQIEQRDSYIYVWAGSTANNSVQVVGPKVIKGVD